MMNKMEMVNNKRVIKKQLDERIAKNNDVEFLTFTWDVDSFNCESGIGYAHLQIMIDNITWKECRITDDLPQYKKDSLMYQCYKATIELHDWAVERYGEDRVKYPQLLKEGMDEWYIYD